MTFERVTIHHANDKSEMLFKFQLTFQKDLSVIESSGLCDSISLAFDKHVWLHLSLIIILGGELSQK